MPQSAAVERALYHLIILCIASDYGLPNQHKSPVTMSSQALTDVISDNTLQLFIDNALQLFINNPLQLFIPITYNDVGSRLVLAFQNCARQLVQTCDSPDPDFLCQTIHVTNK